MSVHFVGASVVVPSLIVPVPWAAPKPRPLTVTCLAVPVAVLGTTALSTANTCGATGLTGQRTATFCSVPGVPMLTPTWVGARSVGMVTPGIASNSVAMVRKRGL